MKRTWAVLAASALAAAALGGTAGAAPATCDGLTATIEGTAGNDELRGTPGDDVIVGLGGNDRIGGRGGNDVICGGPGADNIDGDEGDDRIFGGAEFDWLDPDGGADLVVSGSGSANAMVASAGDDHYRGNPAGRDLIDHYGAPGPVNVDLSAGTITGYGNDTVSHVDEVWGTRFDDTLIGNELPNAFAGRDGDDTLVAGGGGMLSGPSRTWNIFGQADLLVGEGGNDTLIGSDGFDAAVFFDAPSAVTVDLAAGTATGDGEDTLTDIEAVTTSRNGDTVYGTDGGDAIAVSGRAELVDGRGGSDLVAALYAFSGTKEVGAVIDLLEGTIDASDSGTTQLTSIEDAWGTRKGDMIRGTEVTNRLWGRGGSDEIFGLGGDDTLDGGAGTNDLLDGGDGTDSCLRGERVSNCEA